MKLYNKKIKMCKMMGLTVVVFSEMFCLRTDCKTYGKVLTSYQSVSGSKETGDLAWSSLSTF